MISSPWRINTSAMKPRPAVAPSVTMICSGGQAVLHGQLLAQVLCPDIGIAVGQGGLLANSLSRLGGGTKGVFVGGKLQQLGHPRTHTLGLLISANHIRGCFFLQNR